MTHPNNPYAVSKAGLTQTIDYMDMPAAFSNGTLSMGRLRFACLLCVLYVLLFLPNLYLSFWAGYSADERYDLPSQLLTLFTTGIWIYLLFTFKQFLNIRLNFRRVDSTLYLIIITSSLVVSLSYFIKPDLSTNLMSTGLYILLIIPSALLVVILGYRLNKIRYAYPHVRSFAMASMITGILGATIILIFISAIFGVIQAIYLGLIFNYGRRELKALQHNT